MSIRIDIFLYPLRPEQIWLGLADPIAQFPTDVSGESSLSGPTEIRPWDKLPMTGNLIWRPFRGYCVKI